MKKLSPVLITVLVISALGIVVYLYRAICGIDNMSVMAYFPLIMYVLMYISIIRYVFDYFVNGKAVSIGGMLMRYCALTAASILTAGEGGLAQSLLMIYVAILVLVPLMREDINNAAKKDPTEITKSDMALVKKDLIIAAIIAVACVVAAVIKFMGSPELAMAFPGFDYFAVCFDICNPTIQWILFCVLYVARGKKYLAEQKLSRSN